MGVGKCLLVYCCNTRRGCFPTVPAIAKGQPSLADSYRACHTAAHYYSYVSITKFFSGYLIHLFPLQCTH